MCDCEELEFEDFEVMLAAIKGSRPKAAAPPIPQMVVAARHRR